MIRVLFDVRHLYYLPQYLPVARRMMNDDDFEVWFSPFADSNQHDYSICLDVIRETGAAIIEAASEAERAREIVRRKFDVTVFGKGGNAHRYCSPETLAVLLYHGIGIKSCYYTDYNPRINVRYIEGQYRYDELKKKGVQTELVISGFPKLDPLFAADYSVDLEEPGIRLDTGKPTLLYAPTFYPGSLEVFGMDLGKLTMGYNLVIKPHHFSWFLPKYRHQKMLFLQLASEFDHISLVSPESFNIVPLYSVADLLLTEASSTLFEFLCTGKPSIVADFYKLRFHHKLFFTRFQNKRIDTDIIRYMDFCHHIKSPGELPETLSASTEGPDLLEPVRESRKAMFLGSVDGKASQRVVDDIKKRMQ